jgi:HupE / UreJ protein
MIRRINRSWFAFVAAGALLGQTSVARAHESRPGYLGITETAPGRYDVLWRTPILSGMRLPLALRFPTEIETVTPPSVQELTDSLVERRVIAAPGGLAGRRIEILGLEATIIDVLVRVQLRDGTSSTVLVRSSKPWVEVATRRGRFDAALEFVGHGVQHIALGVDHLLFVLGLLLIVRNRWMLLKTVTAFTVAHSITLALATLGYASPPILWLNAAIALSILFLGPEIVRVWRGQTSLTIRRPWLVAFLFGLLHGFGFASALTGSGLPRSELPLALLTFNVGVELGQVAFIVLVVGLEGAFRRLEIRWPGWAQALPGYAVGSLGAFWTIQRTAALLGM